MFLNVSPRVDFIGGGGQGASGSAIVNALGRSLVLQSMLQFWI